MYGDFFLYEMKKNEEIKEGLNETNKFSQLTILFCTSHGHFLSENVSDFSKTLSSILFSDSTHIFVICWYTDVTRPGMGINKRDTDTTVFYKKTSLGIVQEWRVITTFSRCMDVCYGPMWRQSAVVLVCWLSIKL